MTYWFGSLPHGWEAIKLKYLVNLRQDEPDKKSNYIGLEHIEQGTGNICGRAEHPIDGNAIQFNVNDVLFGKLRPYLRKVWIADFNGCASKEILVMQPLKINAAFLFFVLLSHDFIELVNGSTFGAKMPRSDWSFIGNQFIPVPPKKIQERIANNLKLRLGICNQFILENQDKLNRLSEYRQSLITQAVTKGLDPNVEMKDSDKPMLKSYPKHWQISKISRVCTVQTGKTPSGLSEKSFTEDKNSVHWVTPGDFSDDGIYRGCARRLSEEAEKEVPVYSAHSVLFVGIGASIGKVMYSAVPVSSNQQINGISCGSKLLPQFLMYFLTARCEITRETAPQSTLPILNQTKTGEIYIPIPPMSEQKAIVGYVDSILNKLYNTDKRIAETLVKLYEYRSSLITAAVTGKIDISEVNQ